MVAAPVETKICEGCGQEFCRRPAEAPGRWKSKRYCSPGCGRRHASPTSKELFLRKIRVRGECWLWLGSPTNIGRMRASARVLFAEAPPERCASTTVCGEATCVRPEHVVYLDHRERFMRLVEITETCWLWTGALDRKGYGFLSRGRQPRKRVLRAHRVSYEMHVGPIPEGLELDHLCRVRRCVNPAHLEAVTHAENVRRASS